MKLEGKTIVVTGASSGMGKAMTELFVKEGANVVAVDINGEALVVVANSLAGEAGGVLTYQGDTSKRETNEAMIDLAIQSFGGLDALVNNAGVMDDMSPLGEVTDAMYERVMGINVYGPLCAMRKAIQYFLAEEKPGNILNIASVGGYKATAGPIYCASKSALISMTKNTAYMYAPDNIRCNGIAPGSISTGIAASMGRTNPHGRARIDKVFATRPNLGTAQNIANAALFLVSDDSSYISGDILIVDGGWCAG